MTKKGSLAFDDTSPLAKIIRVDTTSAWAQCDSANPEALTSVSIGSLVAVQGTIGFEYLIGIMDRVTRESIDNIESEDGGLELDTFTENRDLLRIVLVGTYRSVEGNKGATFKRGADSYPQMDSPCWVLESDNLQHFMGLLGNQLDEDKQLVLGSFVADRSAKAIADGDKLFQRHAALLGSTGSGKSWAVALILERAHALAHPNLVVFDMHGEYAPLTEGGNDAIASGYKIAGPGSVSTTENTLYLPWWLLNQDEMQALLLDRSEDNAPNQAARLTAHVRMLKEERLRNDGHTEVLPHFTVDSPVPYSLTELLDRLDADDTEMVQGQRGMKQGSFFGRLTRFISRLRSRTEDRRYAFMFAPNENEVNYEWLHDFAKRMLGTKPGIKVIDFSEVPSDVLPIVVGVLARVLYQIHFWTEESERTPVTLVCDEAHLYLPASGANVVEQKALDSFEKIAKEGRKYGMSLLVVSQRPSDVSKTVLSQCNNFIALRLTNDQDQHVVRKLMPDNMESLTASLPLLDIGEALLLGDAIILPTRIKLDQPTVKPASATMNFWSEWNERPVDDTALTKAVEAMRRQSR